ncbi:hypothetical protein PF006_g12038 [Phytophthora fragariae]|uniref:Uncharacterized protein n=1 Tax=Phytophthora fragariae TaxID=53985 RepID=A0A6A3TUQ7_9STRA|nr:hypothetical protein PF006_g12038 [Phytophthora fragariae]
MRASKPQTLEDAVHFAEDNFGEYGESFKVTDWQVARRRYREPGEDGSRTVTTSSKEGKILKTDVASNIDWADLGLAWEATSTLHPRLA